MVSKKHLAAWRLMALACFGFCVLSLGQEQFPPDNAPVPSVQKQSAKPSPAQPPSSQPVNAPAPPTQPATAPSLLDHPAQPAKVQLASGKLTVQADNSSLSEILHEISAASGMKVEGLKSGNSDQRVFGSYGPGAPNNVLSDLLDGAGYNVLMLGEMPSGAPRELALSVRPNSGTPAPQPQQGDTIQNGDNDDDQATEYPDEQQNFAPPPGPPEMRRTPQQMLQELQRQQELQREQQQQNDQPN
jgi:hypothetical protein